MFEFIRLYICERFPIFSTIIYVFFHPKQFFWLELLNWTPKQPNTQFMRNFERVIMPHTRQTRTTWRTRNSAAISYAPILADLELNSLCVRNLLAISTRLNFLMTGTRDVLVKRLQQARSTRTASVLRATTKMAANTWTLPSNNNSTISSNGSRSYLTENLLRYFISWPVDTGAIDCSRHSQRSHRKSRHRRCSSRSSCSTGTPSPTANNPATELSDNGNPLPSLPSDPSFTPGTSTAIALTLSNLEGISVDELPTKFVKCI